MIKRALNGQFAGVGTIEERVWAKVSLGDGCWEWQGAKHQGYGVVAVSRIRKRRVHRLIYEMVYGPIPTGLQIDHLCRNRSYVRPDHLQVVTSKENTLRGHGPSALNASKSRCHVGHPFDRLHTYIDKFGKKHCRACAKNRRQVKRRERELLGRSSDG